MEVVANNYLPGDQHLIEKIVYELKAQGIFDQLRKECFADVDTKPAYQNLRQRVEGSVTGFLREQSWRPDMNKNQVREMLRKTITESGYLETGVERIVDQVVNPKINTVFLPKVEEVVYSYLGIKKPLKTEATKSDQSDLLPTDLEAVSPESEPVDRKDDKNSENLQDMDESKTEEDESPPFEPLDEQNVYVPQEENSVDSHMSGFSGLVSHESNQSNENKTSQMEQDSQMSRNSSDSRLSIVTSDENSKMDLCEDSQSKSIKSGDSNNKVDDKNKTKTGDRHKSRSESKSDKDRKSSKDSKTRHSSSSKDKEKSRDRKDSKSTSSGNRSDKDKIKDKDRGKSSSNSSSGKSSSSKDKSGKRDSSKSDRDKLRSSSTHKSGDSKSKDKSSSSDKHKYSATHSDRHKKEKKRDKPKDDHYSSKDKKNDRRSTDRDSNDGQSSRSNPPPSSTSDSSQTQKSNESTQNKTDSGNSSQTQDHTTKAPIILTGALENSEVTIASPETQRVKVLKPKCASNIQEALRLMKIRKQLAKLEKQNQLCLTSVDVNSPILMSSSINLEDLNQNCFDKKQALNSKDPTEIEVVPSPLQNTVISQDNWDAMEAKLRKEVCSEFKEMNVDGSEENTDHKQNANKNEINGDFESCDCKYFESVDIKKIEFLQFASWFIKEAEKIRKSGKTKRKLEDNDLRNNNRQLKLIPEKKAKLLRRTKDKMISHLEIPAANGKFPLPLSPAESDKSVDKKEETNTVPLKVKRNSINKASNQRYSSDDLYKPRPTFTSSRRRGAKNLEN